MSEEPCTKLGAELSGYHDGVLDEATRQKVESHLQLCAVCRARLAAFARVDRAVGSLGAPVFEDRLREDLVAYTRATIADRGRQHRRQRQLAKLRSWRTVVPLAAAAGVAVLVIKLTDGGFQPSFQRIAKPALELGSYPKSPAETDSQAAIAGSEAARNAERSPISPGSPETILGQAAPGAATPPVDQALATDAKAKKGEPVASPAANKLELDRDLAARQPGSRMEAFQELPPAGGVAPQTQPSAPLAKEEAAQVEQKSAEPPPPAMATPPPAAARALSEGRGRLDPQAALSIAALALQVGDLTGARLALRDLPTLPADSLTARAAVLALTLAEQSKDLGDCKAARERADALVEAAPSSALADTLRVRRADLPCPH